MCKALGSTSSTTKRKPERYFWWNLGGYLIASREKVKSNSKPASTAPDSLSLCEMHMSWSHGCLLGATGILARWGENTEPRFSVTYCTGGIFASLEWGVGKLRERKLSTLQHIWSFERRIVFIEGVLCWILVSQSSSLWVMQCWSWDCPNASYTCQAGGGRKMCVDLCLWAGFCQISTWVPSTLAADSNRQSFQNLHSQFHHASNLRHNKEPGSLLTGFGLWPTGLLIPTQRQQLKLNHNPIAPLFPRTGDWSLYLHILDMCSSTEPYSLPSWHIPVVKPWVRPLPSPFFSCLSPNFSAASFHSGRSSGSKYPHDSSVFFCFFILQLPSYWPCIKIFVK